MNNEQQKIEEMVDVPYYTRDLCKDNKFRLARRYIKSPNVLKYRKEINEIKCEKEYFQTNTLKEVDNNAIKIYK